MSKNRKYVPILRLPLSQIFQAFPLSITGAVRPILPISVYSFPHVDHGVGQSFFNSPRNEGKTSNMIAQMTVQFVSS